MLNARRKKAAEAATTETKPKTTASTTKKTETKKKVKVEGSARTIAIGRRFRDGHEAIVDDAGLPKARAYFDPMGRGAGAIPKDWDKEKTVPLKDLIRHVNEVAFKEFFGQPLRGAMARDLVLGIFDTFLTLSEHGYRYKIPNFMRVETKQRAERMAHNPKTGASIKVKSKRVVSIKPTRAVRDYIAS